MKKTSTTPTEAKIKREIEALKRKPESEIDADSRSQLCQ
jgi:hypothetical protein